MNGHNFTERVRRVLMVAREEAQALHHEYVGTEHLLLGVCTRHPGVGEGVSDAVLDSLGIDRDGVRAEVLRIVKVGAPGAIRGPDLPYTSRAKKVLELAMSEARNLSHAYVGTEHLLLGLVAEERGIAAQILASFGATVENIRAEVRRLLGGEAGSAPGMHDAVGLRVTVVIEHGDGRLEALKFRSAAAAATYLRHLEA